MNTTFKAQFKRFLKQTFIIGALFSSSAFAFIRMMMYPLPIELAEDGVIFIKTILTGWAMVMLGKGAFEGLVFILQLAQNSIKKYISTLSEQQANYKSESFSGALKYAGE
ncbi:hypothetical protein [Ferruginibacter sp.]